MNPLVSILIPAYNAERWLAQTLDSALGQTWPNKEVIVVDDGSRDGTLSVARQYTGRGVKVATQENRGASAARNHAFSLSRGDYIQWLDADDLLASDKIEKQILALGPAPDSRRLLSCSWGSFYYRTARARFRPTPFWKDQSPIEWLLQKFEHATYMPPATWLVSRDITQAAGPWDVRLSLDDDGEYFCRILGSARDVRFVPAAKAFYRMSGHTSLSNSYKLGKKLDSQFLSMELHMEHLRAMEDSERVRRACIKHMEWCLMYFFPARPDLVERVRQQAKVLGGEVEPPQLKNWKLGLATQICGSRMASRAQQKFQRLRFNIAKGWDKFVFDFCA